VEEKTGARKLAEGLENCAGLGPGAINTGLTTPRVMVESFFITERSMSRTEGLGTRIPAVVGWVPGGDEHAEGMGFGNPLCRVRPITR